MHVDTTGLTRSCTLAIAMCLVWAGLLIAPLESVCAETVVCDETTLSVNAADMKAEDLVKAVGTSCGIRMVLRGELFTDDVFSLQFENMPLRAGLDRVLRSLKISNHMLNFAQTGPHKRVVEILLVGKGGGERELTPAAPPPVPEIRPEATQPSPGQPQTEPAPEAAAEKTEQEQEEEDELQEKFMDLLEEILDEHFDNEDDIDPESVLQEYKQRLPEDMRDNIPAEVFEELELLAED